MICNETEKRPVASEALSHLLVAAGCCFLGSRWGPTSTNTELYCTATVTVQLTVDCHLNQHAACPPTNADSFHLALALAAVLLLLVAAAASPSALATPSAASAGFLSIAARIAWLNGCGKDSRLSSRLLNFCMRPLFPVIDWILPLATALKPPRWDGELWMSATPMGYSDTRIKNQTPAAQQGTLLTEGPRKESALAGINKENATFAGGTFSVTMGNQNKLNTMIDNRSEPDQWCIINQSNQLNQSIYDLLTLIIDW